MSEAKLPIALAIVSISARFCAWMGSHNSQIATWVAISAGMFSIAASLSTMLKNRRKPER